MKPLILTALLLIGCTVPPAKPNIFNRMGDTGKNTATAIRVGAGLLIGSGTLVTITTPIGTLRIGDYVNRQPEPQPASK